MVVMLRHVDQFDMAAIICHLCKNPNRRLVQWKLLGHVAKRFDDLHLIMLADHNSILSHLDSVLTCGLSINCLTCRRSALYWRLQVSWMLGRNSILRGRCWGTRANQCS